MAEQLHKLLLDDGGIVCFVGAGGKKTAIQRIAATHPGRIAVTATVFTTPLRDIGDDAVHLEAPSDDGDCVLPGEHANARCVCLIGTSAKKGRRSGLMPEAVAAFHRNGGFHATLVKADGARMRPVKAPQPGEPVLPPGTARVVALFSAEALGRVLTDENAHRLERIRDVTGLELNEPFGPKHAVRLLTSEDGLFRGAAGGTTLVPVINQVEGAERLAAATRAAEEALAATTRFRQVVLTALHASDPVVRVIS